MSTTWTVNPRLLCFEEIGDPGPGVAGLDDDALSALEDDLRTRLAAALEAATTAEELTAVEALAGELDAVMSTQDERAEAAAALGARRDALRARLAAPAPGAPDLPDDEVTAEPVPEAVAASATEAPVPRRRSSLAGRVSFPPTQHVAGVRIRALAGNGMVEAGRDIDMRTLNEILADRWAQMSPGDPKVNVARMEVAPRPGRHLSAHAGADQNTQTWQSLVAAFAAPGALLAAGEACGPLMPLYDYFAPEGAARPVRDSMPSFTADRNGFSLIAPATATDASAGVDVITSAEQAAGTTKPCVTYTCGGTRSFPLAAVSRCNTFGNFLARGNPEIVAGFTRQTVSRHAREAEAELLDRIGANSLAVTAAGGVGAWREYVARWAQAAGALRSRHRLTPRAVVNVAAPQWAPDQWAADAARSTVTDMVPSMEQLDAITMGLGLRLTWYADTETGAGQVFADEVGATTLDDFPATSVYYVHLPGAFGFADGGTLDFGVTRDVANNALNLFTVHVETFEALMFLGAPQSAIKVTHTICASGQTGDRKTLVCPVTA